MSIDFACPKCKKKYAVKETLAGKTAKCAKCTHRIKIPVPAPKLDELESENDLGDWFDDELSQASSLSNSTSSVAQAPASKKSCSACGSPLAEGAVLCVACGFDTRSGTKHETTKVINQGESKASAAAKQTASLARGILFSAIGAALGAAVWVAVVIMTHYEIGWIAWGVGFASGAGMALGHEDNDGTLAGIIAAGMSILGILGAKFVAFEHLKSQIAEAGISLEALSALAGEEITFGSLFGPIDGLFILLAVASAYKVGSGQVTD